jgi:hypothetical protein
MCGFGSSIHHSSPSHGAGTGEKTGGPSQPDVTCLPVRYGLQQIPLQFLIKVYERQPPELWVPKRKSGGPLQARHVVRGKF